MEWQPGFFDADERLQAASRSKPQHRGRDLGRFSERKREARLARIKGRHARNVIEAYHYCWATCNQCRPEPVPHGQSNSLSADSDEVSRLFQWKPAGDSDEASREWRSKPQAGELGSFATASSSLLFFAARSLRNDSPFSSRRSALCTSRSTMASAMVGLPMCACQFW
jgi:hypothetical protein